MMQDVRYAIRQFRRTPGVTSVALLVLALGAGLTTTVFTIVNAALVRPLPFDRPAELHRIAKRTAGGTERWVSVPEFSRWEQGSWSAIVAGFTPMDFSLRGPRPEGLLVVWASRHLLPVLGVTPVIGRGFIDADFHPASGRIALISHGMWQRRYEGDPAIVGSTVDLEGPGFLSDSSGRHTIVGVLPESFWLFYRRTDFIVPMRASPEQLGDPNRRLVATVLARVSSGNTRLVRDRLTVLSSALERERPAGEPALETRLEVTPVREWHLGDIHRPLTLLLAAVVLVVLAAGANVALVLVARTAHRRRELAVRAAVGAGRARLVRQLLTESLLLATLGGVAGVLLAVVATRMAGTLIPSHVMGRLPGGTDALTLDANVVLAAVAASLLLGVAAGLGSCAALRTGRAFEGLRQAGLAGRSLEHQAVQASLVVLQSAVAVVLLVVGGLLAQSLVRAHRVDLGVVPREGLVVWLNLNPTRYSGAEGRARFYEDVLERLRADPEVTHASGIDMPFYFEWQTTRIAAPDAPEPDPERWPEVLARTVTSTYFERHGIRVVAGRGVTALDDRRAAPVAVISRALADRHWPDGDAVGAQLRIREGGASPVRATVVGIVSDVRSAPHAPPQAIVYRPVRQAPPPWMYMTVEGDTQRVDLLGAVRRAVWAVDPEQPLDGPSGPWTMTEWIAERTEGQRLLAAIGNTLAAAALLLAAIGLYGLLSYHVTRRTSEIGVRMALGATRRGVLALVLRQTLGLTLAGVVLGLSAAAVLTRYLATLLFGIAPLDALTFAIVAGGFLIVSLAAAAVPARRAMAVSPIVALKSE